MNPQLNSTVQEFLKSLLDVSVKSQGGLKAATEVSVLKATSAGFVKEVFIKENDPVEKGQLLIAVKSPVLEEKEKYLEGRR